MRVLLTIALILGLAYSVPCGDNAGLGTVLSCNAFTDDSGNQCSCTDTNNDGNCDAEGCDLTLSAPTTVAPDPQTTAGSPATTCICPEYTPPMNTPTPAAGTTLPKSKAAKKSKGSKGSGYGIGECDCSGGVVELRYVYTGTISNVKIELFTGKDNAELICEYDNVQPSEEIVCNLRGDLPGTGLVVQPNYLDKFATESPFVITYPNNGGTCAAQYHTSCSQDIVGVVQIECTELIVSGWRDGNTYSTGGDCDDGIEPCICENVTPPQQPTTTSQVCYCDDTVGVMAAAVTTSAPKSKAGKSSDSDGLGVGDCDCEGGQIDLTIMYQGAATVDITCHYKDQSLLDTFTTIATGEEVTCSVENNAAYDKLGTDSYIYVYEAGSSYNNEICNTKIHTSCSRDIVGTYGEGTCNTDIIVTGWRDANNINDGLSCDDGMEECPCDAVIEEPPNPVESPQIPLGNGQCLCATMDDAVIAARNDRYQQYLGTTTRRLGSKSKGKSRNRVDGFGFGDCDCDGGMFLLRFFYVGDDNDVTIRLYGDDTYCEFDDVNFGEENYCSLREGPLDSNNDPLYEKFSKDTYVKIFDSNGGELCQGSWHTSCSRDVIGYTADPCVDVIISGWNDNGSTDECDDGYEICACDECANFGGEGYAMIEGGDAGDDCNGISHCQYNTDTGECQPMSAGAYKENVVVGMVMVIFGFIILF